LRLRGDMVEILFIKGCSADRNPGCPVSSIVVRSAVESVGSTGYFPATADGVSPGLPG
jgi:hypothetical protein